ncbi:MAG: type 1 glutamine amidotransferase domain-containing protein [Pseudomonadota bacterium]
MANILIVLTSHSKLGKTGRETGFYFDEMAAPYWALTDAGHEVVIASIAGGPAVHDPGSVKADPVEQPEAVRRFLADPTAMSKLSNTPAVGDVDPAAYDAVFLPGGHGTMWDFAQTPALGALVSKVHASGGVVGAVCHGPAGLLGATKPDGTPLVSGLRVNAFTNAEEEAVGLTDAMPFLLETRLQEQGALFEGTENFRLHAVSDGRLVTGQNPASAPAVAALLVEALDGRSAFAAA